MTDPSQPRDSHVDGAPGFTSTEQEIVIHRRSGGKDIYLRGMLYMPLGSETDPEEGYHPYRVPCVVCAHALNAGFTSLINYAIPLAERGYASLVFDFYGAREGGESGGDTKDLSLETQEEDLEAIFDYLMFQSWCDPDLIYLLAEANGANAAITFAGDHPTWVRSLALMYPMAQLHDEMVEAFGDGRRAPKAFRYQGTLVSDRFAIEAIWRDPLEKASHYPGRTLIIHGSEDTVTPLIDAARLADAFPDPQLKVIEGAGHDFITYGSQIATKWVIDFFNEQLAISEDERNFLPLIRDVERRMHL